MKNLFILLMVFCCILVNGQTHRSDYAAEFAQKLEPNFKEVYKTVGDKVLYLHIFRAYGYKVSDRRPCFIAFHGGGWVNGEPRRFYPIVHEFSVRGLVGISVEYRLVGTQSGNTVFDCLKDARSAIRYIRQHANELGVDPDRIIVSGGSAGAHMALGTALFENINEVTDELNISPMPNALVLYYPVVDTSIEGFGNRMLGSHWSELSPLLHVEKGVPPTIVFQGTGDTITPFKGAKDFQTAMQKAGNRCDLIINEGGEHGYMMFEKSLYNEAIQQTITFLNSLEYVLLDKD